METEHKEKLKARMEMEKKKWVAVVINKEGKGIRPAFKVATNFYSDNDTIECVLHKIELDLMTNLHFGFKEPIEIKIAQVK